MTTPAPDALLDVIDRAVSTAGYWLPKPGRTAIAKAVTGELEASQRRAVVLVERIDAARAWARQHLPAEQQAGLLAVLRGDQEPHVCRPGASLYHCPTSGRTESDCHGGFDTCCDRPDLHQLACAHCGGSGCDPEDPGDWIPEVGRHDPGTRGPCPECVQKGLPPRLPIATRSGYCPHCGRGDAGPTADQYEASQRRAVRVQTLLDETRDRMRKLHAEGPDGRCESCGVSWPCLSICRLNGPPGCRN